MGKIDSSYVAQRFARYVQPSISFSKACLAKAKAWVLPVILLTACHGPDTTPALTQGCNPPSTLLDNGNYLYCVTNVGHSLTAFDLTRMQAFTAQGNCTELDPVGVWFGGANRGFYISRVDGLGQGSNTVIEFLPRTLQPTGRRAFLGVNANPNSLFILPTTPDLAWVAIMGSTFDSFRLSGIALLRLSSMQVLNYYDFNTLIPAAKRLNQRVTFLRGFVWDAACPAILDGKGCAYAVLNNWNGATRRGWLLVLRPDAKGAPVLAGDVVRLGHAPEMPTVLDVARGKLWVVNNGGFVALGGKAGVLQELDLNLLANGDSTDDIVNERPLAAPAQCASPPRPETLGCDPTGIHQVDANTAWITLYPNDTVRHLNLATGTLNQGSLAGRFTGPVYQTRAGVYAGAGGFGPARLVRLDPSNGQVIGDYALNAGNGGLGCAEHTLN